MDSDKTSYAPILPVFYFSAVLTFLDYNNYLNNIQYLCIFLKVKCIDAFFSEIAFNYNISTALFCYISHFFKIKEVFAEVLQIYFFLLQRISNKKGICKNFSIAVYSSTLLLSCPHDFQASLLAIQNFVKNAA